MTIKDILEIPYLLSGPVLAYFAYRALDQISLSERLAKENAKRDSIKLTAEECRYYSEKIIPLANEFDDLIKKHNLEIFIKSKVHVENNEIKVSSPAAHHTMDKAPDEFFENITALINSLSSFSTFFVSGVADERLAYKTTGTTYCRTVTKLAPMLVNLANKTHENNILQLYIIWKNRQDIDGATRAREALDKTLQSKKDSSIKVVGS